MNILHKTHYTCDGVPVSDAGSQKAIGIFGIGVGRRCRTIFYAALIATATLLLFGTLASCAPSSSGGSAACSLTDTGADCDADGVLNGMDHFPEDPCAAVDTDSDGLADAILDVEACEEVINGVDQLPDVAAVSLNLATNSAVVTGPGQYVVTITKPVFDAYKISFVSTSTTTEDSATFPLAIHSMVGDDQTTRLIANSLAATASAGLADSTVLYTFLPGDDGTDLPSSFTSRCPVSAEQLDDDCAILWKPTATAGETPAYPDDFAYPPLLAQSSTYQFTVTAAAAQSWQMRIERHDIPRMPANIRTRARTLAEGGPPSAFTEVILDAKVPAVTEANLRAELLQNGGGAGLYIIYNPVAGKLTAREEVFVSTDGTIFGHPERRFGAIATTFDLHYSCQSTSDAEDLELVPSILPVRYFTVDADGRNVLSPECSGPADMACSAGADAAVERSSAVPAGQTATNIYCVYASVPFDGIVAHDNIQFSLNVPTPPSTSP